ncbi:cell wall hydrolase [Caenispirillum salinarum]|uniref:cell wall hydrolase n=1 Tax=Caenispirillum salinarum TaxID=859058 RepID=UPI00385056D4
MKRLLLMLVAVIAIAPTRGEAFPAEIPHDIVLPSEGLVVSREELVCLALNDYFEARGESMRGRVAVAQVVLNRARDGRFPRDLCKVVTQNLSGRKFACQFSWTCDGRSDEPQDLVAWRQSLILAIAVTRVTNGISDPTEGALWYHAHSVSPGWAGRLAEVVAIGGHTFYADPDGRLDADTVAAMDDGTAAFGQMAAVPAPPPPTFAEWVETDGAPEQIAQR